MKFLIAFGVFCMLMVSVRGSEHSASYASFNGSATSADAENITQSIEFYKIPEFETVESLPYIVGLRGSAKGRSYCAGALIAKQWVLTTIACAPKRNNAFLDFFGIGHVYKDQYASIGSMFVKGSIDGEVIKVVIRIPHPDYNKKTRENDYMLLKLDRESKFDPVSHAYDGEHYFEYDMLGSVYGWQWSSDPSVSTYSGLLNTTMHWTSACQNTVGKVYASQFCAIGSKTNDACRVSEGSPIVVKQSKSDLMVGMVSYNPVCGKENTPTLFARASKGQQWMANTMLFYA